MADNFSTCVECNKRDAWIELRLVSEVNKPIKGLELIIKDADGVEHKVKAGSGYALVKGLVPGPVELKVETQPLLDAVEQHPLRSEELESQAKADIAKQAGYQQSSRTYQYITVGDLWTTKPENALPEKHDPEQGDGPLKLTANQSYVLEIKALRALAPLLIDTDKYSLVNGYNLALLAILAYANEETEEDKSATEGSIKSITELMQEEANPKRINNTDYSFIVNDIPHSQSYRYEFFEDPGMHAQAYALHNCDTIILGVRGTEFGFDSVGAEKIFNKEYQPTKVASSVNPNLPQAYMYYYPYYSSYMAGKYLGEKTKELAHDVK